jgi:hypothetical protein
LLHDSIYIFQHIDIPESDDSISELAKCLGSPKIVLLIVEVLAPIEFNDELLLDAAKIHDEPSHRMLAAELEIRDLTVAQAGPELALCIGGIARISRARRTELSASGWVRSGGFIEEVDGTRGTLTRAARRVQNHRARVALRVLSREERGRGARRKDWPSRRMCIKRRLDGSEMIRGGD